MELTQPCAAVACSFIALAAWVRQLPLRLLNSRVVTECLQSGHLNVLKPFIILMGVISHSFNSSPLSQCVSELKLPLPPITCEMAICSQTKECTRPRISRL